MIRLVELVRMSVEDMSHLKGNPWGVLTQR